MHKVGQSGEFLGRLLGPLLKTELSLIGNILKPLKLAIPLGLTAAESAADAAIHKKNVWIGYNIYWLKTLAKQIKMKQKEKQKGRFLAMLLVTLGASLLESLFRAE